MTCRDEIKKDDWGTDIQIQFVECDTSTGALTAVDISGYSSLNMYVKKPSGTVVSNWSPLILNAPGTDGWIHYTTQAGDIDEAGTWEIEAKVTFANGAWRTARGHFIVWDVIA